VPLSQEDSCLALAKMEAGRLLLVEMISNAFDSNNSTVYWSSSTSFSLA